MQKSKHILFLTSWYPSDSQPFLGNYIQQLALALSQFHRITLIYLENSDDINKLDTINLVNDNFTEARFYYQQSLVHRSKRRAHHRSFAWAKLQPKFDLIHVHIGHTNWWHFMSFQLKLAIPMIYSEHGSFFIEKKWNKLNFIHKIGIKRVLNKAVVRTAVSPFLASQMNRESPKEIVVIGNCLPEKWTNFELVTNTNTSTYSFLHISTVDENKNVSGILHCVARLKQNKNLKFNLTILSDESLVSIKKEINQLEIDELVILKGPVKHNELPEIYQSHNCFILNSGYETFSIVLAEALFFGLHVITTNVGFVFNSNEFPVDKIKNNNSEDCLFEKMVNSILKNKRSGESGRNSVLQFSENEITRAYCEIYTSLD